LERQTKQLAGIQPGDWCVEGVTGSAGKGNKKNSKKKLYLPEGVATTITVDVPDVEAAGGAAEDVAGGTAEEVAGGAAEEVAGGATEEVAGGAAEEVAGGAAEEAGTSAVETEVGTGTGAITVGD